MGCFDILFEIINEFNEKFHYDCEIPEKVISGGDRELKEFQENIKKCIDDDFDYTVELYGTVPNPLKPGNKNEILID